MYVWGHCCKPPVVGCHIIHQILSKFVPCLCMPAATQHGVLLLCCMLLYAAGRFGSEDWATACVMT